MRAEVMPVHATEVELRCLQDPCQYLPPASPSEAPRRNSPAAVALPVTCGCSPAWSWYSPSELAICGLEKRAADECAVVDGAGASPFAPARRSRGELLDSGVAEKDELETDERGEGTKSVGACGCGGWSGDEGRCWPGTDGGLSPFE